MVTNSFVNSLNFVTEMSNTSKPVKNQGDDKFKELMKQDDIKKDSDDKNISDKTEKEDGNVSEKIDSDNETPEGENLIKADGTDEKVISGEVAKMLINISPVVTDMPEQMGEEKGAGFGEIKENAVPVIENIDITNQFDGLIENATSFKNESVAIEDTHTIVNGEFAFQEGKIQLDESFKIVDEPVDENLKVADLLNDGMKKNGIVEEKVDETLVANVTQNDTTMSKVNSVPLENSQEVVKSEATFRPEETIDNMVKTFVKEFTQGRREMEIQLEPVNLGKLTIKVAYDAGKAVVSILCTEKNLDIISKNSGQIAGILQQYTGDDTQIVVEQSQFDYLNQNNNENNSQQNREQKYEDNEKTNDDKEAIDFLEQLRLGLVKEV